MDLKHTLVDIIVNMANKDIVFRNKLNSLHNNYVGDNLWRKNESTMSDEAIEAIWLCMAEVIEGED